MANLVNISDFESIQRIQWKIASRKVFAYSSIFDAFKLVECRLSDILRENLYIGPVMGNIFAEACSEELRSS